MTQKREIDEATGLPVLPAGHFWRVTQFEGDYQTYNYLGLHRREPRWYNQNRTVRIHSSEIGSLSQSGIRQAALDMLTVLDYKASQEKFLGDYPPKSLER